MMQSPAGRDRSPACVIARRCRRPRRDCHGEPPLAADLEKVATGEGGVIHGKRIKRFIDLSTTGSRVAQRSRALAKKNIVQIDSPVSGGVGGANKGHAGGHGLGAEGRN
jgi:hypothetical protein